MQNLSRYALKSAEELFEDSGERTAFLTALQQSQSDYTAIVSLTNQTLPFEPVTSPLAFLPAWVQLVERAERPGADPLHESGAYYCCDLSSVLTASPIFSLGIEGATVLDMCASPGGKSVLAFRALQPKLLVSNEAIDKRVGALIGNIKRCRLAPVRITSADPQQFARLSRESFEVVLVDAPCSGQSLLAKGIEVPGAFHPVTINSNSNRQKRILAAAAECVAPGGYLLYTTCTFAPKENERVVSWLLEKRSDLSTVAVHHLNPWLSRLMPAGQFAYRFYPHQHVGAGGFTCLFKRLGELQEKDAVADLPHIRWQSDGLPEG